MSNYICFKDYNDYELIYLIKEGNEKALYFFFEKYDKFIKKIVLSFIRFNDFRFEDYLQEGRMVLYECIYSFEQSSDASFFSYFLIIFKRKLYKLLESDEYEKFILREDIDIDYIPRRIHKKYYGRYFFDDKLKISIFDKCIMGDMTLRQYSKNYNIPYNKLYYIYQKIISELKYYYKNGK